MISRIRLLLAVAVFLAACAGTSSGFEYRVASKDPTVSPARMLMIVNRALEPPEASASTSAIASTWAKADETTGEVTFGLGALGSGKSPSIRNTEARLLEQLRHEFGDRVEVYCNGEPLR